MPDENGLLTLHEELGLHNVTGTILGSGRYNFVFDNNSGIQGQDIKPPTGWMYAIAVLNGWQLRYKDHEDHHFGLGKVFVWPGNQGGGDKFTLRAQMHLRDENGDDYWRGEVQATVLFYG